MKNKLAIDTTFGPPWFLSDYTFKEVFDGEVTYYLHRNTHTKKQFLRESDKWPETRRQHPTWVFITLIWHPLQVLPFHYVHSVNFWEDMLSFCFRFLLHVWKICFTIPWLLYFLLCTGSFYTFCTRGWLSDTKVRKIQNWFPMETANFCLL